MVAEGWNTLVHTYIQTYIQSPIGCSTLYVMSQWCDGGRGLKHACAYIHTDLHTEPDRMFNVVCNVPMMRWWPRVERRLCIHTYRSTYRAQSDAGSSKSMLIHRGREGFSPGEFSVEKQITTIIQSSIGCRFFEIYAYSSGPRGLLTWGVFCRKTNNDYLYDCHQWIRRS